MADALTVGIIQAKSKTDNLGMITKLNLSGIGFEDVSILRQMPNLEVVSLPVNRINSLKEFQYLSKLTDLSVRKNNISQISNLLYLRQLPNLKNLWMMENPISSQPNYRLLVVALLPQLEKLDNKDVTAEERSAARQVDVGNIQHNREAQERERDSVPLKPKSGWDSRDSSQPGVAKRQEVAKSSNQYGIHRSRTDVNDQPQRFNPKESNLNAKLEWSADMDDQNPVSQNNHLGGAAKGGRGEIRPKSPRGQWSKAHQAQRVQSHEEQDRGHERYSSAPTHHHDPGARLAKADRLSPNEHVIFAIMELVKELNPVELDYIKSKVAARMTGL